MAKETNEEESIASGVTFSEKDKKTEREDKQLLVEYSWDKLASKTGNDLGNLYEGLLAKNADEKNLVQDNILRRDH